MKFVLNQPWADFAKSFMSRERWSRPASRFDPEGVGASKPADEGVAVRAVGNLEVPLVSELGERGPVKGEFLVCPYALNPYRFAVVIHQQLLDVNFWKRVIFAWHPEFDLTYFG